jgi:hypothetical protein
MAKEYKTGRVVRVTPAIKLLFKQILLDMERIGSKKNPDQIADEVFELGVCVKSKMLRDESDLLS